MTADVVIIGAGPYGFAAATEIHRRGFKVTAIGRPFETWHEHTLDRMLLRSDARASTIWSADDRWNLPGYLAERGITQNRELPVDTFRAYLRAVTDAAPFQLHEGLVERLDAVDGGFRVTWDGGEPVTARAVVVATGMGGHQVLPEVIAALPPERVVHSWDTQAIQKLTDQSVLVIGGGQSAAESVEDLMERNRVTWALREAPLFFREPLRAPTPIFKAMLATSRLLFQLPPPILRAVSRATFRTTITPRLKAVYEDDRVETLIRDAEGLGLSLADDGSITDTDGRRYNTVVSATGFRHTVAGFSFLAPSVASAVGSPDGPPPVDRAFESGQPGLFFIGGVAESVHGPAMRFVVGCRHSAIRVADRIERNLGGSSSAAA
jgi:lysine/ornithine N-monooxygenase